MLTGIWAWIVANPTTAIAIGVALYAFLTGKVTLQGLLAEIVKDLQAVLNPQPVPPPVVGPVVPGPVIPVTNPLIQELIDLLLKSHASGDTATHDAVLKVLEASRGK